MKSQQLFRQLQSLTTERRNQKTMGIDLASVNDTLRLINAEDRKIAAVVAREIPSIALAVRYVVRSFKDGGRLFYVGAGTSGRLGSLDASECTPTVSAKAYPQYDYDDLHDPAWQSVRKHDGRPKDDEQEAGGKSEEGFDDRHRGQLCSRGRRAESCRRSCEKCDCHVGRQRLLRPGEE